MVEVLPVWKDFAVGRFDGNGFSSNAFFHSWNCLIWMLFSLHSERRETVSFFETMSVTIFLFSVVVKERRTMVGSSYNVGKITSGANFLIWLTDPPVLSVWIGVETT